MYCTSSPTVSGVTTSNYYQNLLYNSYGSASAVWLTPAELAVQEAAAMAQYDSLYQAHVTAMGTWSNSRSQWQQGVANCNVNPIFYGCVDGAMPAYPDPGPYTGPPEPLLPMPLTPISVQVLTQWTEQSAIPHGTCGTSPCQIK